MVFINPTFILGLATLTGAFFIPESISLSDTDAIGAISFEAKAAAQSQTLNLECPGCPIAIQQPSGGVLWMGGIHNQLQFQFTVAQNKDILFLNGLQIYPSLEVLREPLTALQITASGTDALGYVRLGYELAVTPVTKSVQDQLELITIHLQILEIGGRFVGGLESVELNLLKTPIGKLLIGDLHTAPATLSGENCETILCKMRTVLREKFSYLKPETGCGSGAKLFKLLPTTSRPHKHGDHSPHHSLNHHRKLQNMSRLLRTLKGISLHVLMPVFIGIAAGFAASLIGMFVGQTIVFLWRTFYRRDQNGNYSRLHKNDTVVEKHPNETKLTIARMDSPPAYADISENDKDGRLG